MASGHYADVWILFQSLIGRLKTIEFFCQEVFQRKVFQSLIGRLKTKKQDKFYQSI